MVFGHGLLATAFQEFESNADVVIFASGVSDSNERRATQFAREADLLRRARREFADRLLVYFGTCSVHDSERRDTPYVRHKLAMEAIAMQPGMRALVLRLPLAIGADHRHPTLANFLYQQIVHQQPFDVWTKATRYPVDVDHVLLLAKHLLRDASLLGRQVNIALRSYAILDFVRILERIAGKPARFKAVDRGAHYSIPCPEVTALLPELGLTVGEDYLERTLRKYFGATARPFVPRP
jgi:hypothetical protein